MPTLYFFFRIPYSATPLVVLLVSNFVVLLIWSLVDPLVWQRFEVNDEAWNSYGICVGSNQSTMNAFLAVLGILNIGALGLAILQAWRARSISDEYSETKSVGVALYSWLQLFLVGVPVLFLIDRHNTKARYFLISILIFLVCMSMLLIIFVPLFIQIRRAQMQQKVQVGDSNNGAQPSSSSNRSRIPGLNVDLSRVSSAQKQLHDGSGGQERDCNEREPSSGIIASSPVQFECSQIEPQMRRRSQVTNGLTTTTASYDNV